MKTLLTLLAALLRLVLPAVLDALNKRAEQSPPQPQLRDRLVRRVRRTWPAACVLLLAAACAMPGCRPRSIYVPAGEPVRLRQTVRGAKVWVLGADGRPTPGVMDLPEGWYCLPDPGPAATDAVTPPEQGG